jgi:hypothetical protein
MEYPTTEKLWTPSEHRLYEPGFMLCVDEVKKADPHVGAYEKTDQNMATHGANHTPVSLRAIPRLTQGRSRMR